MLLLKQLCDVLSPGIDGKLQVFSWRRNETVMELGIEMSCDQNGAKMLRRRSVAYEIEQLVIQSRSFDRLP